MGHKISKIIIYFVIFLGVFSFFFYSQLPDPSSQLFQPSEVYAQEKKPVYYCPMHPGYVSDKPGDCPICYMKLVKKEPEPAQLPAKKGTSAKDICYHHNCPMVHGGQPCPMLVVAKEGEEISCPVCGKHVVGTGSKSGERKILYWTDPMIPGYKSDQPGKSPMGMDLVAVYEEISPTPSDSAVSPTGYASILVTPQKQQLIGLKTAAVQRRSMTKTIRAVGTVAHDPELYQAQSEYLQAMKAWERAKKSDIAEITDQAKRLVESTRIRLKHLGLTDELMDEMDLREEPEHSLLFAHPGEPIWIYAQAYEYELPLIHVGQEASIEVPGLSGEALTGTIRAIDPMVEATTRTTRIRIQVEDSTGELKPDMYVNVSITVPLGEVLAIPEEAVFNTGAKQIVFVDKGRGLLEPRDVSVGAKADGYYELKKGVSEGESVVISGNFLIDSESRLKAVLEGF